MTNNSINTYYLILEIDPDATIEEIKRAYRQKAKELHPDKNKKPDAHDQFILLTEAYECLINLRTGRTKVKEPGISYEEWQRNYKEETRRQAREYARMQYEEFKKTDYYKKTQAALTVIEHLYFFSSILVILSPLWGYLIGSWTGFWFGALFAFLSVHYWAGIFKEKMNINFPSFFRSLILIIKTKTFRNTIIIIINLVIFFRFTLNTQLTFPEFAIALLAFYTLIYLIYKLKLPFLKRFSKTGLFLCFAPSIFNLFFLINFLFSSNPATEVYSFVHKESWYGSIYSHSEGQYEKIAYIDLENDKYEEYNWFRMFFDFDAMKDKSEITYTFEDGLFGLRVLKKYDFTK